MRLLILSLCIMVVLHSSFAPPVIPPENDNKDSDIKEDLKEYMEYHRYLQEVVQALESDPEFRERLEKADEDEVRSGKIAEHLDFVNHNVRTKLDEIKRREMKRLQHLATKQYEITNNLNTDIGKVPDREHLDHGNPHTFEIEDLKKLIMKTSADLEAADKQRKQDFKEYEMQKEFDKKQKIEELDETHKKEYMEKLKAEEQAKKHHQPIHHPGSKQQLEEVWEKQDHMEQQPFDPKAFFMMHDVDGNGVWDADEVKALFIKELDKLYSPNGPNKDLKERREEMERMREHVFKENDRNGDGLIDFNEFLYETKKEEFNRDEGWQSIDENKIYTQAEYDEYQKRKLDEIRYLQNLGLVDAHGRPIPGAEHQINQALHQYALHQGYLQHPSQQGHHPGQVPQGYPQQQVPQYQQGLQYQQGQQYQGQQYQGQQYQGQQYQGQPYQGQQNQGQQNQEQQYQGQQFQQQGYQGQQGQYQQPPQGQIQAQQPPQGQFQGQQPPQRQFQGQQPPQGQFQGQQPPQGQFQGQKPPQAQDQEPSQGQLQGQQSPQSPQQQAQFQAQPPQVQNVNVNQGQAPPVQAQVPQAQTPPQAQSGQAQAQIHDQAQVQAQQTQGSKPQ